MDPTQELSTLLVWAMSIEIMKRVEMRRILGLVEHLLPTGLFVCSSSPLVDAALGLTTTNTTRQIPGQGCEASILTAVAARAIAPNEMGAKYLSKTMPMSSLSWNHVMLTIFWNMGC